ncbi:TrkA C-terminal domain-containing protein [Halorussus gelatinilyticus]|uniref:TrkA C-terminal domain-containing protein n=1 Tax=Halorussus gelatinilyticus TaxID=2937524 RepID=A0A8U0IJ99_9EURY|nr:TrkA C-terminal domain-containing protein [Halorussus gelatinilyticus]UPW01180.1 TrkA C-terminal domain-containing protein [Halorussus gelatinilyticus]
MALGAALLIDLLVGLYVGVLTAVVPALVAWSLGFTFKYFTGVTIPGFGVLVFGVAIAGVQGGLLGLLDPQFVTSPPALVSALVVMMATLYAHAQGDRMGAEFPRRLTLSGLRERGLSADAIERVGRFGQIRIRTVGEVGDVEGYPPLPDDLRTTIRDGEWTLPADLPLSELETRLSDRLRTDYDLAAVTVSIDSRGRATVNAAPPVGALSRRVPAGERAVSVETLVPTGLARTDEVTVSTPRRDVTGTVLSARSGSSGAAGSSRAATPTSSAGDATDARPDGRASDGRTTDATGSDPTRSHSGASAAAGQATGGDGRVTVAVPRREAETLLGVEEAEVRVRARGTRREFELLSLLRRDGKRVRRVELAADGPLDGAALGETNLREAYGVAVLGLRRGDEWTVAPRGATRLAGGDLLFVVGDRAALDRFAEVAA